MASSRRRWVWAGGAAIVLLVLGMFWVGIRAAQAQHALSHAGQHLQRLQRDLLNGDTAGANAEVRAINGDTSRARAKSGGWVFGLAADVPYLGRSPRSVRSLSRAADDLARGPLRSMLDVQSVLSPKTLRGPNGAIDLTAIAGSAPRLQAIAHQVSDVRERVQQSSHGAFVLDPMDRGRAQTLRMLDRVTDQVTVASRFAAIGPSMLGSTSTRRYLVVVQNNNQARGTGGVADAYATVDVRLGQARVTKVAPIASLRNARSWTTANLSPDFPTAAARWRTLYLQVNHGARVDGVIGLDPVTFAHALLATGPVQLNGRTVATAASVVHELEVRYATFSKERVRKLALSAVTKPTLAGIFSGKGDAKALATQLGKAANEGHLHLWSLRPSEQAVLDQTSFAGALPSTPAPFAEVVVNNASGARLDYFLTRSVAYSSSCSGSTRRSTIAVRLDNNTPSDPPRLLVVHTDHPKAHTPSTQLRLSVRVYATAGSKLDSATLDGAAVTMKQQSERGHPVYVLDLVVNRFATRALSLQLVEPRVAGAPVVPSQPLARPQTTTVDASECSSG